MKTARAWLLILALVLVGAAATGAQGTQYEVIRIPIPTYANLSSLGTIHLNDVGQVVGYVVTNEAGGKQINHAFLWDNRGTRDLGFPTEALSAVASSINNQGQVVGYALYQDTTDPDHIISYYRPQVWQGSWRVLDPLGGQGGYAFRVQRDGTLAVGNAFSKPGSPSFDHACVWDIAGTAIIDLGTLGGPISQAYGISATGEVVGYNTGADGKRIPYLWVPNTTINFALPPPAGTEVTATDINSNKLALSGFFSGTPRAFYWVVDLNGKTAQVVTLDMPASSLRSGLVGINDHCQAVGNFQDLNGKYHAILARVLRTGDHKWVDLNDLLPSGSGWELAAAQEINNRGEIVGRGKYQGTEAFFLLRPLGLTMERRYKEVVPLGDLGGGGSTEPLGLNNSSRVVGSSKTADGKEHAFLWAPGYKMADLGVPTGYTKSVARSINASGVAAATAYAAGNNPRAFLWGANFGWEDLGTLGGAYSEAYEINNYNQVAGAADDAAGHRQPCYWYTGIPFSLNTLGGQEGFAYAINRGRTIVGWSQDKTNAMIGCYWLKDEPQPQALPNLPGCDSSVVDDVNNTPMPGTLAVGNSMNETGGMRPALWNLGAQTVISLGNLGLSTFEGQAWAINDRAQVVGWSNITEDTRHAFLVDPGLNHGNMTDLNQLIPPDSGWELYEATAINNRGEIVGTGCNGCEGGAAFYLPVQGVADSAIDLLLSD